MLQTVVLLFSQLSECTACFNPWIFVPPKGPDGRMEWLHGLCLSLSYAIIEPVAVLGLQASGVPLWVLTLCLGPLGATAAFVFVVAQDPSIFLRPKTRKSRPDTASDNKPEARWPSCPAYFLQRLTTLHSCCSDKAFTLLGYKSDITSRIFWVRGRLSSVWCVATLITRFTNALVGRLRCENFVVARFMVRLLRISLWCADGLKNGCWH
jgi:hypothetical protein